MLNQAARDTEQILIQHLTVNMMSIVYLIIIARLIPTVSELGALASFSLFISLISMIFSFSIGSAVTRYTALEYGRGRHDHINGIFRQVIKFTLITSTISLTVSLVSAKLFLQTLIGLTISQNIALLISLDIPALVFQGSFEGALKGLQNFRSISMTNIASNAVKYITAIVLLILGLGIKGVLLGWIVGDYFGLLILAVISYKNFKGAEKSYPLRPLFNFSLPLWINSITSHFTTSIDRYLVAFLAGPYALGIYSPALTAVGFLSIVSISFNSVIFPRFSHIVGGGSDSVLKSASKIASRYSYLIYTPLAFGLASISYPATRLLLGERYLATSLPLIIIAVALALVTPTCIPILSIVLARGNSWIIPLSNLIAAAVCTGLAFILIPSYIEIGGALAKLGSIFSLLILPLYILRKEGNINLDLTMLWKSLSSSMFMIATLLPIQLITSMRGELLPIYVFLGGIFYLFGLISFKALSIEDASLLASMVPSKIRPLVYRLMGFPIDMTCSPSCSLSS